MTADDFRATLERFGLTQLGAAEFLDVGERTVRRWATGEIAVPRSVALLFGLMTKLKLRPSDFPDHG